MRLLPLLICVPALCQPPDGGGPVISFDRIHHSFGKIAPDQKVTARFKVTNKGRAPLQIRELKPACGCTSTMAGQWHLKPGESTEIEVGFDPKSFRGPVRKSLQVVSDDTTNPVQTLTFEAEVVAEVMPSTTSLFFTDLPRNGVRKTSVRLASGNGQPVKVTETKAPGAPYLTTTVTADGKDAVLEVQMDGKKISPAFHEGRETLTVRTTSAKVPVINISIQWELKHVITATPARVAWVETAGKELKATVQLKHADGKAFKIISAKPSLPQLRVEGLGKTSSAEQSLQVVLAADAKAGQYNEKILLTLDEPEQSAMEIPVSFVLR